MLSFLHDYLLEPIAEVTREYVLFPITDILSKVVTAAATKNISSKLTAVIANKMMAPEAQNPLQLTNATLDRLANLQINTKRAVTGCTIENLVSASLKLFDIVLLNEPQTKIVTSLVAKSYNLALTTPHNKSYNKEVMVGVGSHVAGIFMQESVDSLLPQAAPYAGYVAYGIASGLTQVGLERTLRR